MDLPGTTIALICVAVALFGSLSGVVIGALSKKSNPTDLAAAIMRGLLTTGAAIVGTFAVIGVLVLLA
ncbi:hypothetical protein [Nocardia takedensis]|uniref:hypothetical protein n=1 Tax=Nocardia takedensis TaxID=259390 RepID=UPI0012F6B1C0|nr:hypothetical protein [Nocardia takedensis]